MWRFRAPLLLWLALMASCARLAGWRRSGGPATPDPDLQLLIAQLAFARVGAAACTDPERARRFAGELAAGAGAALAREEVDPRAWQACLRAIQGQRALAGDGLLAAVVPVYLELLADARVDTDERRRERLLAAHRALWDRPPEWTLPAGAREQLSAGLRAPAGATARGLADEASAALEMEAGRYQQAPVALDTVKTLESTRTEPTLRRMALRLPDPATRDQARQSVLRLAVSTSSGSAGAEPPGLAERAMADGANRLSLSGQNIERAEVDRVALPFDEILVHQDVTSQRATLLSVAPVLDQPGALPDHAHGADPPVQAKIASPAPAKIEAPGAGHRSSAWPLLPVPLGGVLKVSVRGLPEAVTVCGGAAELDARSCVAPGDIAVAAGPARYHPELRALLLKPELPLAEVAALAAKGSPLEVGLRLASQTVPVRWPLRFARPADLVFSAARGAGPDLTVDVRAESRGPVVVRALPAGGSERLAVLERADLAAYHIASRGAEGDPGAAGRDGQAGEDGMDGSDINCSISRGLPMPGTPGGKGGDGEPGSGGGRGRNGGAVRVHLTCAAADCPALEPLLRAAVRSDPGAGGRGGAGGKPGLGGRGGQFGHCTDRASALTSAADGQPGQAGPRGPDGNAGAPGAIEFQVTALR